MTYPTELSRPVSLGQIESGKKLTLTIDASADECKALANRLEILDIKHLHANLTIGNAPIKGNIRITGTLDAKVVQACSVTFAPVVESIKEEFVETLTVLPENLVSEDEIDGDDDVPVELITGDSFDAGEIVTQWLTLSLNPFPRSKTAAEFDHSETPRGEDGEPLHTPFSVLSALKDK